MINEHHGVGLKLSRFMAEQYGSAWPLLERIKHAVDPQRHHESRQGRIRSGKP